MAKIPNMNQLMKMAQDMSKQMEDKMSSIEAEGNAGGGMVKVILNGHKNILSIEISKEVVDPDDVEMLQDLITAAFNDAIKENKAFLLRNYIQCFTNEVQKKNKRNSIENTKKLCDTVLQGRGRCFNINTWPRDCSTMER